MRFSFTKEMNELEKIFKPYEEGCHLAAYAPKEAIEAEKKYMELFRKLKDKNSKLL